jgi:hypothetical protein
MLTEIEKFLAGKKTYLQVAVGFAVIAAIRLGLLEVDAQLQQDLMNAIILGSIAALRAGVK